jgi:hypothetical protein
MGRWVIVAIIALGACQPIPPTGDVLSPRAPPAPVAPPAVDGAEPTDAAPPGGFDFAGEDRGDDKTGDTDAPLAPSDLLAGMGIDGAAVAPAPVAPPAPVAAPIPAFPTVDAGVWGVRLVSTISESQPPSATLAFADGKPVAVTPGQLLPDAGIVVLAIGRDQVQLARVVPEGDHAKVETLLLEAMYPITPTPAHP